MSNGCGIYNNINSNSVNFALNLDIRPSIFEIFAAECLDKNLLKALSRLLLFTSNKVKGFGIGNVMEFYHNEVSSALIAFVQFIHLRKYKSSFGEKFYGLQRYSKAADEVETDEKRTNLTTKHFNLLSLVTLILVPYLEEKFERKESQNTQENSTKKEQIINVFLYTCKLSKSAVFLLYLSRLSRFPSLLHWLSGISIKFAATVATDDTQNNAGSFLSNQNFTIFEILAFSLQFLQYWQTHIATEISRQNTHMIPSITMTKKIISEEVSNSSSNLTCPMCNQSFNMPTVNLVTGYIYCWKCIALHLSVNKFCPITNVPTAMSDLIRIYDE